MVRRTRLRSIVLPIVLYLVLGVASGCLVLSLLCKAWGMVLPAVLLVHRA